MADGRAEDADETVGVGRWGMELMRIPGRTMGKWSDKWI